MSLDLAARAQERWSSTRRSVAVSVMLLCLVNFVAGDGNPAPYRRPDLDHVAACRSALFNQRPPYMDLQEIKYLDMV
jgi:hypothetical protein